MSVLFSPQPRVVLLRRLSRPALRRPQTLPNSDSRKRRRANTPCAASERRNRGNVTASHTSAAFRRCPTSLVLAHPALGRGGASSHVSRCARAPLTFEPATATANPGGCDCQRRGVSSQSGNRILPIKSVSSVQVQVPSVLFSKRRTGTHHYAAF